MKKCYLLIACVLSGMTSYGQPEPLYYLNESFEEQEARTTWISFPADTRVKWTYKNGGYNSTPVSAFDGDTNAILQFNDWQPYVRTLISPPINLQGAVKPMLSFAHAQYPFVFGQDELRLLFRAGATASWDTILVRTEEVEEWDELFFNIDEYGSKYLVNDFYLGFCGTANNGNGVCIDKVVIEEKGFIPKYIRNFSVENVEQGIIPSGINNVPLMKVYLEVFGNVDSLKLNSISFTSTSTDNSVFKDNGFRLYATTGNEFKMLEKGLSTLITPSVSINSGIVTFSGIDYWLKTGQNFIWLALDVKPDRYTHGSTIDFKLLPNSISINSTLLPSVEANPGGSFKIAESVFLDDFESSSLWSLSPDFEIAIPQGFIIGYTRDPGYAYSGQKSLGTDLTQNGAYLMNINQSNAYYAVTPPLNLKYFIDARLHMKTWNGFDALDNATIDVSSDNGATWTSIWVNTVNGLQAESKWNDLLFKEQFDDLVRKKDNVRIRFAMNYSDNQFALSGWNIDNFAVTGNHLDTDLEISNVVSPYNDCFGTHNDTVKIIVKNNAAVPSPSMVPVYFALQGKNGARVYDTITSSLAPGDSILFRFTKNAGFPAAGDYHNFTVALDFSGDEDTSNNVIIKPIYIQRSIVPPSFEKFENNDGYWRVGGNSSWECMQPDGSIPVIPESPVSWMESPYGGYANNDTSWVVSSCYDLSHDPDLIVELKLWIEADQGKDGLNIQYTYDNGQSWHIINNTPFGINWGWYTEQVAALGAKGWTRNTTGWKTVRDFLPITLLNKEKVQFRAYWRSDASVNARGVALDDFRVFPAPPDIGVSNISSWVNTCQFSSPEQVTVTVKNFGMVTMKQNDTIVVGYEISPVQTDVDTFLLTSDFLPGQSFNYTFDGHVGEIGPGNYSISAYTLIEYDPYFYGPNNDSTQIDFVVYPGPLVGIPDTISTREPDSVIISPLYDPDYDYLWHDMSTLREFHVQYAGWHKVMVTDARGNGCSAKDSTYVQLLFNDAGASELVYPTDHCGLSENEFLTVRVKNYGTDVISAGQKIAVIYELNGGTPVADTLQLNSLLSPGHTMDFTFDNGPVDLSQKGIFVFKLYTSYGGDTIPLNDTIIRSVEMLGRPQVYLGPDITVEALSHTLDAGAGYQNYLWDNEETGRTRLILESGTYWVRVYDQNQCDNYDTVQVRLKIRDIGPASFDSPVSDCSFNPNEPVVLRIKNSGTDTVPSGSTIQVSYRFEQGTRSNRSFVLNSQLIPGATVEFPFGENVDVGSEGEYIIEATAVMSGDLRNSNDTAVYRIYRYPGPVVDFGLDETEYIEDVSFDIDAGFHAAYSYQWQDTSWHTSVYTVTESGLCHVKVTDTRTQCYDGDSVIVFLIYGDVGVTWTDMPVDGCTGEFDHVKVRVTNLGPSVIGSSAPIYVACDVNGSRVTIDTLIRTGNFNPGATLDLTLSGEVPVSAGGLSKVSFHTLYAEDKKPENDTLEVNFDALAAPVIDFGDVNGNLSVDLPHELNAGAGHQSYLWQDNSTNQTFNVIADGEYTVTVTGQNDCQTIKTVRINMQSGMDDRTQPDVLIYPNPGNGLFHIRFNEEMENVTVKIFNNQGQVVYIREFGSMNNEPVDVQHLTRGLYHILIQSEIQSYQGKIVIQ
jgi:Secretion system C-terminal sorting domain